MTPEQEKLLLPEELASHELNQKRWLSPVPADTVNEIQRRFDSALVRLAEARTAHHWVREWARNTALAETGDESRRGQLRGYVDCAAVIERASSGSAPRGRKRATPAP